MQTNQSWTVINLSSEDSENKIQETLNYLLQYLLIKCTHF